ncbi:MAG: cation:proton antiporter [Candidatus Bipolaricaulota bacterium]|nr:cation:proton antiporter [Candidatus Bipolaricaulota bacterium]
MIEFALSLLTLSAFLCLFRIGSGPTPADRMVAIDILGILVVGFCALFAVITDRAFYLNIALAWGLLSFIGTTALAKYLEGKKFDE